MEFGSCWEAVVENVSDGLLVIDIEGKIMAVNPAMENMTGYSSMELLGKSCKILNCTGCQILGGNNGAPWCKLFVIGHVKNKECIIAHKNGRTIQVLKSGKALHDSNGNLIGVVETLSDVSELIKQRDEIKMLKKTLFQESGFYGILGNSQPIQKMFELIESVAHSEAPVLIQGESGTGKELAARAIHEASPRKNKPFIKVNCAALNENLLESELFGHVKGAFTGADKERIGRFEAAHGGTIFLDEIGDIPLATQVKLLRVLEEREVEKVGDHKPVPIDVRIVSATNRNLNELIKHKKFREDFFFRINVFPILCPTLSSRKEDIPILTKHFIDQYSKRDNKYIHGVTNKVMEAFLDYNWPGNIRELRNIIEYALVLCPGELVGTKHLPPSIVLPAPEKTKRPDKTTYADIEKNELIEALQQTLNNKSEAAKILGISRVTVWKRIKKYGLSDS
jgi:transcriptional regulator with PAS, ATPase and Fis domain